jgi:hypothetical protein
MEPGVWKYYAPCRQCLYPRGSVCGTFSGGELSASESQRNGVGDAVPTHELTDGVKSSIGLILRFILLLSEAYRVTEPEKKRHGHNVQYPPIPCKPLELIHG